jgi:hypothetical protein
MMEMQEDNAFVVSKVADIELELQKMKEEKKKMARKLWSRKVEQQQKKMLLIALVSVSALLVATVFALLRK